MEQKKTSIIKPRLLTKIKQRRDAFILQINYNKINKATKSKKEKPAPCILPFFMAVFSRLTALLSQMDTLPLALDTSIDSRFIFDV